MTQSGKFFTNFSEDTYILLLQDIINENNIRCRKKFHSPDVPEHKTEIGQETNIKTIKQRIYDMIAQNTWVVSYQARLRTYGLNDSARI